MPAEAATQPVRPAGYTAAAPLVHVVVCARNNRSIIGDTLSAIGRQTIGQVACTLVDGVSTDGTPALVRERFPWVDVIVKERDSGPAASRNIGMRACASPYIVFVDSDVRLAPDWIDRQVAFLQCRQNAAMACGKLVYASAPETLHAAYGAMNRIGVAWNGGIGRRASEFNAPRRCLWLVTAAVIVRRSIFDRLGGFDERMFAYYEDTDLGWRANLFGYHAYFNPEAVALHEAHATLGQRSAVTRERYLVYRNRMRTLLVNYEAVNALRYLGAYVLLALVDAMLRPSRAAQLRAILWNVANLADSLRRRREIQSRRTVRDRDLWQFFDRGLRGPGQ